MTRTTAERRHGLAPVLLLVALFLTPTVVPGAEKPTRRIFLGAAFGYYYSGQSEFRNVYDRAILPLELSLGWKVNRRLSLFAAVRHMKCQGETVVEDFEQVEESYPVQWRMLTVRLGGDYFFSGSRLAPFLGVGASYSFYKEEWPSANWTGENDKAGFFVQGGGCYRFGHNLDARLQLEYSSIPAGRGSRGNVNLGGLTASLGLTVAFL